MSSMETTHQSLKDSMDQKPSSPSSSPNSSNNKSNGVPPPLTPRSITNPNSNPIPTTFIQADTQSFKQVVQMLTGSPETTAKQSAPRNPIPPISRPNKKPAFKLYERRSGMKNLKMISPLIPNSPHPPPPAAAAAAAFSPRNKQPDIPSPSILDFPKLALSPVTPLTPDPFNRSAEDRAIADKRFYLHPSTPRDAEPPKLLPLFPLTSPRMESSAAAAAAAAESSI